jgi:hypothetical protein
MHMGLKPSQTVCLLAGCLVIALLATLVGGCTSPTPMPTSFNPVTATPTPVPTATPVVTVTPSPVPTPTVLPTITPTPTPAPNNIVQAYQWQYKGRLYQFQLTVPEPAADNYRSRSRSVGQDYASYAITGPDRPYLPLNTLMGAIQSESFGEYDAVMLVQAFVESLQNTPGLDDRPKYPVETLLDRGGDSEDTSILAAALLNDLGYDSVILGFPGHTAVGVKGTGDLAGRYYNYRGADYYYLETAIPGYDFGTVPEEYRNVSATVYPMSGVSLVTVTATVEQASEETLFVYYNVSCIVRNAGAETTKGVAIHFTALAPDYGPDKEWELSAQDVSVGDLASGESRTVKATIKIPRSGRTQVECIVTGDNFDPVVWKGEQFTL